MHHRKTYMYINFQQNRISRSVKTCTQIFLQKFASCINLQLPIVILKKTILLDMHHHKTYMHINFQQNRVKTQVITVLTSIFAKNRKLHKFATTCNNFEKSTLSDKHHLKTYMNINFQQNRVSRSVKIVHTNLFAKNCKLHKFAQNCKLHKFATTNSNFEKNQFF